MLKTITNSEEETRAVARRLAGCLCGGDVISLDGPLGAGKTCFVRGLAEGLGIDPRQVSSPTFILCQEYEPPDPAAGSALTLAHLDGYRLASHDELETIGWDELLDSEHTVIAVEWANRIAIALPDSRIEVQMAHVDEYRRELVISVPDGFADRLSAYAAPSTTSTGSCPICNEPVDRESERFPFCSKRCRLVDLCKWLGEGYRTSRAITEADELWDEDAT